MRILYITTEMEDYLADSILYGLRKKYGPNVVDFPKKELMYINSEKPSYGGGFTLWGLLPDIRINRDHIKEQVENGYFDVIIFSDIYRQQEPYAHWNVYKYLEKTRNFGKKIIFLDGSDDGKPAVVEAFNWGPYFKRDNPYNYSQVKLIGLSIPECKILAERPIKTKLFTRYVQPQEAWRIPEVQKECSEERFLNEEDYYADLAVSAYGFGMKKSGWDTPRLMEHAANWVVNCIWTKGWEWDPVDWYHRAEGTSPLGLIDGVNCLLFENGEQLMTKINSIDDIKYQQMSQASHNWVLKRTCEKMAEYVLKER